LVIGRVVNVHQATKVKDEESGLNELIKGIETECLLNKRRSEKEQKNVP
jgi:hypothetical protein